MSNTEKSTDGDGARPSAGVNHCPACGADIHWNPPCCDQCGFIADILEIT